PSGTKPECVLESTVSQSALLSRIGWHRPPTRASRCPNIAPRTHRKRRDVCATRQRPVPDLRERSRNVSWNQRFHKVRSYRGLVGTDLQLVRPDARTSRLAHIAKGATCAPPDSGPYPTFGNEAGMCPGINGFTKCAPIADR